MAELLKENSRAVSALSARVMVFRKFFDASMPHFTTSQRAAITPDFRRCIEDLLSHMDDVAMPVEFQTSLLESTNSILAALDKETGVRE
jgi:hypothetical protein